MKMTKYVTYSINGSDEELRSMRDILVELGLLTYWAGDALEVKLSKEVIVDENNRE